MPAMRGAFGVSFVVSSNLSGTQVADAPAVTLRAENQVREQFEAELKRLQAEAAAQHDAAVASIQHETQMEAFMAKEREKQLLSEINETKNIQEQHTSLHGKRSEQPIH